MTLPIGILLASLPGSCWASRCCACAATIWQLSPSVSGKSSASCSKATPYPLYRWPQGCERRRWPDLFGSPPAIDFVYLILLAMLLIILVTNRLQNQRIGRAWVAMREDETVARAMGIDVVPTKLMAFAIGAAFAGLGGVLFAARNQFTGPEISP